MTNPVEGQATSLQQLARGLLDAWQGPVCAVDSESKIVAVNQVWRDHAAAHGGTDESCGVGVSYLDTCDRAAAHGGGPYSVDAAIVAQGIRQVLAGSLGQFGHDYPCDSPSQSRWFNVRLTPAVINDGMGAVISHLDITELHESQRSIAHQSLHDPLTDLPNRELMLDRLEHAVNDADRNGLEIAVTHLDLHRYGQVNDRFGYRGGDAVLVRVAERLQAQLRPGDTLSRSSGDKFMVLWADLDPDRPGVAVELSQGLVHALDDPFDIVGVPLQLSASAGVAMHTRGQSVDELLQSMDAALQDAKSRGPGHVARFTHEVREATTFRRSLEADLRQALVGTVTQFVLHYQPVVDLASGRVAAVEALVRWQHPVWGLLGPDRFIPLAEATGLIHQLGDWVLEQAVQDAATLTHQGRELDVAVNFSVRQLDDRTVAKLQRALERSALKPGRLIVEVTESAIVEDQEGTATTLEALSQLGVKIAVDDFGTGYSSLLYLRRYPVDILKIDREFVAGIGLRADDEAICASITDLATAVGASTVGEGVETMQQYAFLRSLGCRQGQGFLWSPAVALDKFEAAMNSCDQVPVAAPRSLGAPPRQSLDPEVTALIAKMHAEGAPLHAIAAALNRTIGRNPSGERWTAGAVARGLPAAGIESGIEDSNPAPFVLICNDVEPIRRLLRIGLEQAGFAVEEAADGRAAMARLIQTDAPTPAVIVLDSQQAPYDAWWAIAAIRAHHTLDDVPVLLVTTATAKHASVEADEAGFDATVTKPFPPAELVKAVSRLATTGRSVPGGPKSRFR